MTLIFQQPVIRFGTMFKRFLPSFFCALAAIHCTPTATSPSTIENKDPTPSTSLQNTDPILHPSSEPSKETPRPKPVLGWSSQPLERNSEAYKLNRAGLKLHRAGDYKAALELFDKALTIDPEDQWARYNRACALSQLQQWEQASADLEQLLRQDLPTFGPKLAQDQDLQPLLQAPTYGSELRRQHEEIVQAYQDVIAKGIPAMTYRLRAYDDNRDASLQHQSYEDLQLGIYDPIRQRFIPTTPIIAHALAGLTDRDAKRALVVSGKIIRGDMWVVQPSDLGVHLFDLSQPGKVITQIEHLDRLRKPTREFRSGNSFAIDGDSVRVTYHSLTYAERELTLEVRGSESSILADTNEFTSKQKSSHHVGKYEQQLTINGHGAYINGPLPADFMDKKESIHFPLIGDNQRIEQTPVGRYFMLFAQVLDCHEDGERLYHRLARYDSANQTLTWLSQASSQIGAALGPDGSIFMDDGGRVNRFPPGESKAVSDVPAGVHFMIPGYGYDCSI